MDFKFDLQSCVYGPCIAALQVLIALIRGVCLFACTLLLALDHQVYACFMV